MTQHLFQLVKDMPRPKGTPDYYWKQVQVTGFMCYCRKCNRRIDKTGIIPEKCPNCGNLIPTLVICPGRLDEKGKLRHVCKEDCSHSVPHNRRDACDVNNEPFCFSCISVEPPKESKIEYKMKCKYCGDIQILNEKSFIEVIENGCDEECWECRKRGYEPVIPEGFFVLSYVNLMKVIQDHPYLEMVNGEPEEDNRLCYTNSCPKWLDDICRNSTGCADCSTRTTEPPTGNLEIENAAEIENGPKIVHGGVTFESSEKEPKKDDCPHKRHGNEMFNGRPRTKCWDCDEWLEPDFDSDVKGQLDPGNDDCLCDKEPVVWVVVAGHGELNWACPNCKKIYGNWKPFHLRKEEKCWLCEGTGFVKELVP